jgi:hypothetical protein
MSVHRKIVKVPAILDKNEWRPDITQVPKGVGWVLLEFDHDNDEMVIELFASDHATIPQKVSKASLDALVLADTKMQVLASHPKSPPVIFWTDKNGVIQEEG